MGESIRISEYQSENTRVSEDQMDK